MANLLENRVVIWLFRNRIVKDLVRILFRLPRLKITREAAESIAEETCRERGWPWRYPLFISEGLTAYIIVVSQDRTGGNVVIGVNINDGTVVFADYKKGTA